MEGFIFRKGFVQGVQMYLWWDSDVGKDSYKEFKCIYGGIHRVSSYIPMDEFICSELFI